MFAKRGRAAVLERPFAEPRLQHLEVEDAREAPATPERQAERELQREEREQEPPPGHHGDERHDADDGLVHSVEPARRSPACRDTGPRAGRQLASF